MPVRFYDSWTYHAFFPARWVQEGKIFLIPSVFGDLAPTYAPIVTESWMAWLMLPLHSDVAARISGIVPLMLLFFGILSITNRLQSSTLSMFVPASLAVLSPWALSQGSGTGADLPFAAGLIAALALMPIIAEKPNSIGIELLCGAGFGICAGTKFIGLPAAMIGGLPLLFSALKKKIHFRRISFIALSALVIGGYGYIRNLILTGNPFFPLDITVGGIRILPGIYSRDIMIAAPFHVPNINWAIVILYAAFGVIFGVCAFCAYLIVSIRFARDKSVSLLSWPIIFPLIWFAFHFLLIPYNSQERFLLPAISLAFVAVSIIDRKGFAGLPLGLAAQALYLALSINFKLKLAFMVDQDFSLPVGSIFTNFGRLFVWLLILLGCLLFVLSGNSRRLSFNKVVLMYLGTGFIFITLFGVIWPEKGILSSLDGNSLIANDLENGCIISSRTQGKVVAYAGTNAPYPLLGVYFTNKVIYMPINKEGYIPHIAWKNQGKIQFDTDNAPSLYRSKTDQDWWSDRMKKEVSAICIRQLSSMARSQQWSDPDGFPVERELVKKLADNFKQIQSTKNAIVLINNSLPP